MLIVTTPNNCVPEIEYVLDILLSEFLGLNYRIEQSNSRIITITHENHHSKICEFNCTFFELIEHNWLDEFSLPKDISLWQNFKNKITFDVHSKESSIPIFYGKPRIVQNADQIKVMFDLFGTTFFLLSLYEEGVKKGRDEHGRFTASQSLLFQSNLLNRPVVNEYLELLWGILKFQFPTLKRKTRFYEKIISCDVDHPIDLAGKSSVRTLKRVLARVVRDRTVSGAWKDLQNYGANMVSCSSFDQYLRNIYWIMDKNEAIGNKLEFYIIPFVTDDARDEAHDYHASPLSDLLRHIIDRGHKIGVHPGYATYNNELNFQSSVKEFQKLFRPAELDFENLHNRQHYLCFDVFTTPLLWERFGVRIDSTLTFADSSGFRCGTCYAYPMYSLAERRRLHVFQQPLTAMEYTVIGRKYENLGITENTIKRINSLKETCKFYNGTFTLLWHNSFLQNSKYYSTYESVIS